MTLQTQGEQGVSPRLAGESSQLGAIVDCIGISHGFPRAKAQRRVLDAVNLSLTGGEFLAVVGPSGCGKTTLLRMISGVLSPQEGRILIDGTDVTGKPNPDCAMVFQNSHLLPWRSALRNVTFGLEIGGVKRAEAAERARDALETVGLGAHEDAYPAELSGGMQQRVNIARALVLRPRVMLMDEPFASLDSQTREIMQRELLGILGHSSATVVFVTHQIDEAIYLSDRVLVLGSGRVHRLIDVPFPRPRELKLKRSKGFQELCDMIWGDIEGEVMREIRRETMDDGDI
jgi:NitT/TauT family transport system ATP-binding protein